MAKVGGLAQMGAKSSPKIAKGSSKGAVPPKGMGMGMGTGSPKGMGANPAGARGKPVFKYGGAVMKLASGGSVSSKGVTNPWMQNWDTGESRAGRRGDARSEGRNESRMGGRPDIRENRAGGRSGGRGAVKPMPMDDDDGDNDMKRGGAVKKKMARGGKVKLAAGGKVPGYALGDLVERAIPLSAAQGVKDFINRDVNRTFERFPDISGLPRADAIRARNTGPVNQFLNRVIDRKDMGRRKAMDYISPEDLALQRESDAAVFGAIDRARNPASSKAGVLSERDAMLDSMSGPLSDRDLRMARRLTPTEASIGAPSDPMSGAFAKGGRVKVKGSGAKVPKGAKGSIKGANMMARGRGYSSGGEVMLSSGKTVSSSFSKLCSDGAKMGFKNSKGR